MNVVRALNAKHKIPATSAVFAAFLGFNPVTSILTSLPQSVTASIPSTTVSYLTGTTFFPNAIAPAFMSALRLTFYIGLVISLVALVISYHRGTRFVIGVDRRKEVQPTSH